MIVKANNININYEVKGNGENLVLIHGAGDNLNMWYNQVPFFQRGTELLFMMSEDRVRPKVPKETTPYRCLSKIYTAS